jgi:hypothetical protein
MTTTLREVDNRDASEVNRWQEARVEALKQRTQLLEALVENLAAELAALKELS